MKAPARKLQAKTLATPDLNKVNGGRGSCCGSFIHCDQCGNAWYFWVNVDPFSGYCSTGGLDNNCPFCGAQNW